VVSVRLHYFLISLNIILVAMATFLDKLENKVTIHHLQKKLNEVSKPLHLSTNPDILVKIAPLVSELWGLESRPLKKIKKK